MDKDLKVRLGAGPGATALPALLVAAGKEAAPSFERARGGPGMQLLLRGDRDYHVRIKLTGEDGQAPAAVAAEVARGLLLPLRGRPVWACFVGRSPVRRRLELIGGLAAAIAPAPAPTPTTPPAPPTPSTPPLDLVAGLSGAAPLFLFPDGRVSDSATSVPEGLALQPALTTFARWVSARRTSTFERLFPPSAFHPDEPVRNERLSLPQAQGLLGQLRGALQVAAVGGAAAQAEPQKAALLRSAALTVLSHLVATALKDPSFRAVVDGPAGAAAAIFGLIDQEQAAAPTARPALRAHAIQLLQLRAPALAPPDRQRAAELLRELNRAAPPYDQLRGPWRFAMCSAWDFHEGEVEILRQRYGFKDVPLPADAPKAPGYGGAYTVLQAPFAGPAGQLIQVFSRSASPRDETQEMGQAYFTGLLINRHAQLGSFDMQSSSVSVRQVGYKLMMNTQCAGLTTRFAIAKLFPEADIYSSWDSTYFHTGEGGKVTRSEGLDCFVALLTGMSKGETHAQIAERMRAVQWHHEQATMEGFCQFIGPSHPQVVARYSDVNSDGRADYYDGYLDLDLQQISEDLHGSATPRDPALAASQVGGEAARGLGWAAGSLNRVTQYSDLWAGLPGESELLYVFQAAGFYSHREPPRDVPGEPYRGAAPVGLAKEEQGHAPALCRFVKDAGAPGGFTADVLMHSFLAHSAGELKRLLCAASAVWTALDLGYLPRTGLLASPLGQRGMVLLTLAGLLEFPADQNFIDGLWSMALTMLRLPPISRSVVRGCITEADHDASNYYGSRRGLRQLIGEAGQKGALEQADPVAFEKLRGEDPSVGRAAPLPV